MNLLDKPLHSLTAEDLMTATVVTIPVNMSLRCAARTLTRAGVSGAPVVDETGRCVGVLSTTDFLKLAGFEHQPGPFAPQVECDWQVPDPDEVPDDDVRTLMTADPVTVGRQTLLGDLARRMLDAHIHRVIVDDGKGRPVGIVSTIDVLAAVARFVPAEATY